MPTTIEKTVYTYDELGSRAQERARRWWCRGYEFEGGGFIIDDFATICELIGVELRTRPVPLYGGGTRHTPQVWWWLSYGQGGGASFDGTYAYKRGALAAVRKYAPEDDELHKIVASLQAAQRRNFYRLEAVINSERDTSVSVGVDRSDGADFVGDAEGDVKQAMHDLCSWLYSRLKEEYEYQTSEEAVAEALRANAYTFDEHGNRED